MLDHYDTTRTYNGRGLTIPSQRACVQRYMSTLQLPQEQRQQLLLTPAPVSLYQASRLPLLALTHANMNWCALLKFTLHLFTGSCHVHLFPLRAESPFTFLHVCSAGPFLWPAQSAAVKLHTRGVGAANRLLWIPHGVPCKQCRIGSLRLLQRPW